MNNYERNRKNRLYNILSNMKQRCYNPNAVNYKNYGGRGIEICEEWLNDSMAFMKWAYSNGYKDNLSIDRIDNDKGYYPNNCRWATTKEQSLNTSRNVMITINGDTKTLIEWCSVFSINPKTVDKRRRSGWPVERYFEDVICTVGENNGNAKLKEKDVIEIKEMLANGIRGTDIAKKYNVSKHLISKIKNKKMWK